MLVSFTSEPPIGIPVGRWQRMAADRPATTTRSTCSRCSATWQGRRATRGKNGPCRSCSDVKDQVFRQTDRAVTRLPVPTRLPGGTESSSHSQRRHTNSGIHKNVYEEVNHTRRLKNVRRAAWRFAQTTLWTQRAAAEPLSQPPNIDRRHTTSQSSPSSPSPSPPPNTVTASSPPPPPTPPSPPPATAAAGPMPT